MSQAVSTSFSFLSCAPPSSTSCFSVNAYKFNLSDILIVFLIECFILHSSCVVSFIKFVQSVLVAIIKIHISGWCSKIVNFFFIVLAGLRNSFHASVSIVFKIGGIQNSKLFLVTFLWVQTMERKLVVCVYSFFFFVCRKTWIVIRTDVFIIHILCFLIV